MIREIRGCFVLAGVEGGSLRRIGRIELPGALELYDYFWRHPPPHVALDYLNQMVAKFFGVRLPYRQTRHTKHVLTEAEISKVIRVDERSIAKMPLHLQVFMRQLEAGKVPLPEAARA